MNRKQSSVPASPESPLVFCRTLALHTSAWFSVLSTLVLLIYIIRNMAPSPLRLLLLLPLSLCLAAAARVRRSSVHTAARIILHALLTVGGLYVFAYLPVQIEQSMAARTTLLFLFLVILVYAIAVAVFFAVVRHRDTRAVNEQPYRSQFGFGKRDD